MDYSPPKGFFLLENSIFSFFVGKIVKVAGHFGTYSFLAIVFLIICFNVPMYPYRSFRFFAILLCLLAISKARAQEFAVYDSLPQLISRIQQAGSSTLVLNFWATWCKPCVAEMPYIERLHDDFSEKKLSVILVSLDFPDQIESKLIPFVEQHKLKSTVLALTDGNYNAWIDRVDPAWGGAIPVTIIYNDQKRVFIDKPFGDYEELKAAVGAFF